MAYAPCITKTTESYRILAIYIILDMVDLKNSKTIKSYLLYLLFPSRLKVSQNVKYCNKYFNFRVQEDFYGLP